MKDCAHVPELGGEHCAAEPRICQFGEYLHYNEDTGVLIWKKSPARRVKVGDEAGTTMNGGYKTFRFKGLNYKAHRVAFRMIHGHWPMPECDHINGNKADNRACNLREATHAENMWNKRLYKNNKSGVKGVFWDKKVGKWRVRIKRSGQQIAAGYYKDIAEATQAVAKLREQFHGDFAKHATQH